MKFIITPVLKDSLPQFPQISSNLSIWMDEVADFLEATGVKCQAELTGNFIEELLVGRMNIFITPGTIKKYNKQDLIYQIKYFEEKLNLPTLEFIYGYGRLQVTFKQQDYECDIMKRFQANITKFTDTLPQKIFTPLNKSEVPVRPVQNLLARLLKKDQFYKCMNITLVYAE